MIVWEAQTMLMKMFLMVVALIIVFAAGLVIGIIIGLFLGNGEIGDAILEMIQTYQLALDEELGYE